MPIVLTRTDDDDFRSALALRDAIARRTGFGLAIETHARTTDLGPRIELRRSGDGGQGYRIRVRSNIVTLTGGGSAGLRYGVETLSQLTHKSIPVCDIDDAPDLDKRGLLIDVSRGKVPTLETLEEIGIRGREQWRALGGESLELIPCLNDHPRWVDTIASWVRLPDPGGSE